MRRLNLPRILPQQPCTVCEEDNLLMLTKCRIATASPHKRRLNMARISLLPLCLECEEDNLLAVMQCGTPQASPQGRELNMTRVSLLRRSTAREETNFSALLAILHRVRGTQFATNPATCNTNSFGFLGNLTRNMSTAACAPNSKPTLDLAYEDRLNE